MLSSLYNLLPYTQTIKEVLAQVRAGSTCMLNITGEVDVGKAQLLDAVHNDLLLDQELVVELDLSDYEAITPLILISALSPLVDQFLLASGFARYCKKELNLKLLPYLNVLKQALPKLCDEVIGAPIKNNGLNVSEEVTFRLLINLLREALGADIPLFILINHFERAPSSFAHMISELKVGSLGVLVCIQVESPSDTLPSFLRLYQFPHYQSVHLAIPRLTQQSMIQLLLQWPAAQAWPHEIMQWIAIESEGKLAIAMHLLEKVEVLVTAEKLLEQPIQNWPLALQPLTEQPDRLAALSRSEKNILALATIFSSGFSIAELLLISEKEITFLHHLLTLAVEHNILKISTEGYYYFQYEEDRVKLTAIIFPQQKEKAKSQLFEWILSQDISESSHIVRFVRSYLDEFIARYPAQRVIITLKMVCRYYYCQRDVKSLTFFIEAILTIPLSDKWFSRDDQMLELFNQLAEESLLIKDRCLTQSLCKILYKYAPSVIDMCSAVEAEIKALLSEKSYAAAQVVAVRYLSKLGRQVSTSVTGFTLVIAWIQVLILIRHNVRHGYPMRSNTEKESLARARILKALSGTAYVNATDKMFLPSLILLGVRWALEKGVGPGTMYAVYGYKLLTYVIKEQYPLLFRIALLRRIVDKSYQSIPMTQYSEIEKACFDDEFYESRTLFTAAFLSPFTKSLQDGVAGLLSSYEVGLLAGNWEFASYSSSVAAWYMLMEGHSLQSVLDAIDERYQTVELFGYEAAVFNHAVLRKFVLWAKGMQADTDEVTMMLKAGVSRNSDFLLNFSHLWRCMLERDYDEGLRACERTLNFLDGGLGLPLCPYLYVFYIYCLVMTKKNNFFLVCKIKFYLARLAVWSEYNGSDFKVHELLAKALLDFFCHKELSVVNQSIEQALSYTVKVNNHYLSALSCELYIRLNKETDENAVQQKEAARAEYYEKWGFKRN